MNGSEKIILDAIKDNGEQIINLQEIITTIRVDFMEVKTLEKAHHSENTKKIDVIFKKMVSVNRVDDLERETNRLHWLIFVVIILGILMKIN